MSLPTFAQTAAFHAGQYTPECQNGFQRYGHNGTLTLDGSHGAALGDIPASLFRGASLESVIGGINTGGTQFVQFVVSPDGSSLLSLNSSGVPTNAPTGSYQLTVISLSE